MENLLGAKDQSGSGDDRKPKKSKRPATDQNGNERTKKPRGDTTPDPRFVKLRAEALKKKQAKEDFEKRRIFVGIDFGCTATGVAYVSANESKEPQVITSWSQGNQALLPKAPSVMAYASENPKFGGEDRSGCDVRAADKKCAWFKLRLDESVAVADFDDALLKGVLGSDVMALPPGKSAQQVTTDYLKAIKQHVFAHLDGVLGGLLKDNPLCFCLTVPATWNRAAREATRKAAELAGFGDREGDELILHDEPTSAILDVLHSTVNGFAKAQQSFQKGICVLCCDMGGGTTDLITYRIASIDPLRIEEASVGEGAKIGATTVDREWWRFCQEKFGAAFDNVPPKLRATGSKMMVEFEDLKQRFQGTHVQKQDKEMFVTLRMADIDMSDPEVQSHWDEDEDNIRFTSDEMEQFFEPVLQSTFGLLKSQINRARSARMPKVQCLVLCGGLASSPYVQYRVKKYVLEELDADMKVIIPEHPAAAIARGASIYARQQKLVVFRKSRDSIGIIVHRAFKEGEHDEVDRIEVEGLGTRASNQMYWGVTRAQKIYPGTRAILDCSISIPTKDIDWGKDKRVFVDQAIYASSSDQPPTRLDTSCNLLAKLKMDVTTAAHERRRALKKELGGKLPKAIDFDVKIELLPGSEKGVMQVKATTGARTKCGSVEIVYESDANAGVKPLRAPVVKRADSED